MKKKKFVLKSNCIGTKTYWESKELAEIQKKFIDECGCSGRCRKDHVIFKLKEK